MVAAEEGPTPTPTEELTVGCAVSKVVGADSFLLHITVGTLGDGPEVVVFRSAAGGHAEGERLWAVAVDAVGAAAGFAGDGAARGEAGDKARGCGCQGGKGGKAEDKRCGMHLDKDGGLERFCL